MSGRTRAALITIVSLLTLVLAVVFASRFGTDPRLSPSPLIGQPAPDPDLAVVESDDVVRLSTYAGDVVVVNFWAPWCVPCRAEHPALLAVADEYAGFGVTVLGITYQSTEDAAIAYLDELGRGYPVVMDDRSRAAIEFGVRGVPETFVVDRDGVVVAKVAGPITYELLTATLDRVILGLAPDTATTD